MRSIPGLYSQQHTSKEITLYLNLLKMKRKKKMSESLETLAGPKHPLQQNLSIPQLVVIVSGL